MSVSKYENFIPQNIAPKTARMIGIYTPKGKKVGQFGLQHLAFPTFEKKQYSFGAVSDPHFPRNTALEDFQRAIPFLHETEKVAFTCICGDLTQNGTIAEYEKYAEVVGGYKAQGYSIRAITGNHDYYGIGNTIVEGVVETYTGDSLYYSFTQGNDVFIMVGIKDEYELFTTAELQWLYETLEANRNKRCFVFQHVFPGKRTNLTCGNAYGIYDNQCWGHPTQTELFENLMKHYKNVVFFHGHSHLEFALQSKGCQYANYSDADGYRSIHIPSLTTPRTGDESGSSSAASIDSGSQGYVVDVYSNGIHLRGRDFASEEYLPIASYWVDTTLQTIPAKTFTDSTGTITT